MWESAACFCLLFRDGHHMGNFVPGEGLHLNVREGLMGDSYHDVIPQDQGLCGPLWFSDLPVHEFGGRAPDDWMLVCCRRKVSQRGGGESGAMV